MAKKGRESKRGGSKRKDNTSKEVYLNKKGIRVS